MNILITGASGFVGSSFLKKLIVKQKNDNIFVLSRNDNNFYSQDIKILKCDIFDSMALQKHIKEIKPEILIHIAWISTPKIYQQSIENLKWLESSMRLIKIFIKNGGKRIVITGSCNELKVNNLNNDVDLYTITKHSLHLLSRELTDQNNVSLKWARLPFMFGPFEAEGRLVSFLISEAIKDKNIILHYPNKFIPLMYIDDVTSKLAEYCFKSDKKIYNIFPERETNIFVLAKNILNILNSKSKILNKENLCIKDDNKIKLPIEVMNRLRQYAKNYIIN